MKVSNFYLGCLADGKSSAEANKLTCEKFGLDDMVAIARAMHEEKDKATRMREKSIHTRGHRDNAKIAGGIDLQLHIPLTKDEVHIFRYISGPMFRDMPFTEVLFEVARCIHEEQWSIFIATAVIVSRLQADTLKGKS